MLASSTPSPTITGGTVSLSTGVSPIETFPISGIISSIVLSMYSGMTACIILETICLDDMILLQHRSRLAFRPLSSADSSISASYDLISIGIHSFPSAYILAQISRFINRFHDFFPCIIYCRKKEKMI